MPHALMLASLSQCATFQPGSLIWIKISLCSIHCFAYRFLPFCQVPDAACKIKSALPNVKLLVILRDPVARIASELTMMKYIHHENCPSDLALLDVAKASIRELMHTGCTFQKGGQGTCDTKTPSVAVAVALHRRRNHIDR